MTGVLIGFSIIAVIIAVGYIVGRLDILGQHSRYVISRLVFFVLSPCLLFTVLADADVHDLFSSLLLVSLLAALLTGAIFAVVARLIWRRKVPEITIGVLASGYVNINNIGIPVAVYVLGDPAFAAPVLLCQLLLFAPVALSVLDAQEKGRTSVGRLLLQPFKNPMLVGSLLGVIVALSGVSLPDPVMEPFRLIGAAAVPLMLITFGISLHGQRPLAPGTGRRDVLLASGLKAAVMPAIAWLLAEFVFSLSEADLFTVVVLAALPTAQNVFTYAQRYERGEIIARDTALITTVAAIPVLIAIAALLH